MPTDIIVCVDVRKYSDSIQGDDGWWGTTNHREVAYIMVKEHSDFSWPRYRHVDFKLEPKPVQFESQWSLHPQALCMSVRERIALTFGGIIPRKQIDSLAEIVTDIMLA